MVVFILNTATESGRSHRETHHFSEEKSANISPYPDEVIDRLARAFYPAILACWNSEEGQQEFAPIGELPVVHIVIICGLKRKFYKQHNSQRPVCNVQFTVVAIESNRELLWQGASYLGAHPVFILSGKMK